MKRCLFNVVAVLSLLLCLATAAMWVRSHVAADVAYFVEYNLDPPGDHGDVSRTFEAQSSHGMLALSVSDDDDRNDLDPESPFYAPSHHKDWDWHYAGAPPLPHLTDFEVSPWGRWRYRWHGFALGSEFYAGAHASSDVRYITAPYWSLVLLFAVASGAMLRPMLRRYRSYPSGHCVCCGYDLRATPDRCPECGLRQAPSSGTVPASSVVSEHSA